MARAAPAAPPPPVTQPTHTVRTFVNTSAKTGPSSVTGEPPLAIALAAGDAFEKQGPGVGLPVVLGNGEDGALFATENLVHSAHHVDMAIDGVHDQRL